MSSNAFVYSGKGTLRILGPITNIVALVDDCPQVIGSGPEIKTFGVSNSGRNKPSVFPVKVVTINRGPDGIAPGIGRIRIGCRGYVDVKLLIRADSDVFQFVAVCSPKVRAAAVR